MGVCTAPAHDERSIAMVPVSNVTASYGYALWKSGPAVSPAEVESARESVVEVLVLWGTSVLHVAHVAPSRGFYLGEATDRKSPCDFYVGSDALGSPRAPLVVPDGEGAALVLLPRSTGTLEVPGEPAMSFAELVASGRARPSGAAEGAHEIELVSGAKARVELEGSRVTFQVGAVMAGKRVPAGLSLDQPAGLAASALSLLLHLGLVSACAFFMPRTAGDEAEDIDRDRILLMQRMLDAKAAEEQERKPVDGSTAGAEPSGGGASAPGSAGTMGATTPTTHHGQYAIAKTTDDPQLARERALNDAKSFAEAIALLSSPRSADPNVPVATWGAEVASGSDTQNVLGALYDSSIGEAQGTDGLSLSGTGEGGDGHSHGIGLGEFGGLSHGFGPGGPGGVGHGSGVVRGTYHPKSIGLHEGVPAVNGRLPREIIQRIVRQNFGRFRLCYENGLRGNPGLEGRVEVKFVIDRAGAVSLAADGGSALPNQEVVQCVVRGFRDLSFPAPEGGMVTVNYPIALSPSQ